MDEQNQNQMNQPSDQGQNMPPEATPKQSSIGPVVGVIIIVAVLVLGGLYYWGVQLNKEETADEIRNMSDEALENLETQGTSDTLEAIEADLDATNLDGIDAELDQIDADLDSL